jgi:hypothetical protein
MLAFTESTLVIFKAQKEKLGLEVLISIYAKSMDALKASYKKLKKNLHTQSVEQLDAKRDLILMSILSG